MIEINVSEFPIKTSIMQSEELIHIVDKQTGNGVGYFISEMYVQKISNLIEEIEKEKRVELLKKVARARKQDPIGDS